MARRLLFFPILRTRSARKVLVGGSVIVLPLAIFAGCDKTPPNPDLEPTVPGAALPATLPKVQRELERLAAEAGIESAVDPPAPSGDLKNDVESFTTLDACVRTRKIADPLIGDAIDALGYDTLTRDACRILQALKEKRSDACKPIAASGVRARCETYVAVLTGDPGACPTSGSGRLATRDPVCLARANRDERLCAAAPTTDRARCRALVLGRRAECGRDEACARQVARYESLFEKPATHTPLPTRLHVDVAEQGTAQPSKTSFDLDDVAAAGAVVRASNGVTRVTLGTPKNALWPTPDALQAGPRVFVEWSAATSTAQTQPAKVTLGSNELRLDLLVPKVALLSSLLASDVELQIETLSSEPAGPIKFVLESTLREAPRTFRVKLDVETFVREAAAGP
jgi:hypothetical protein